MPFAELLTVDDAGHGHRRSRWNLVPGRHGLLSQPVVVLGLDHRLTDVVESVPGPVPSTWPRNVESTAGWGAD